MPADERLWRERGLRAAVLAGDERAWTALYDETFADLHAYVCWRSAGLPDLAEEVVQETWLTAVRRMRVFDPAKGSFAGWVRGIAAHVLRNHIRRRRGWRLQGLNGQEQAAPADADLERRDRAERIARALAALPAHYEAVLRAKYLDGQTMVHIATQTNSSVKAVESLLSRARQAFREAFLHQE